MERARRFFLRLCCLSKAGLHAAKYVSADLLVNRFVSKYKCLLQHGLISL